MRDRRGRAQIAAHRRGWVLAAAAVAVLLPVASVGALVVHGTAASPAPRPDLVTACGSAGPSPVPGCPGPAPGTLRALAARHGLVIGSAANAQALAQDPQYAAVLAREFDAVTPEDAMKWSRVEPRAGQFDWSGADRVVDFAQRNGQQVYGHTLLWYASTPDWLAHGDLTGPEVAEVTRRHIADEVGRYQGKVWAWDVVNEPLTDGGQIRATPWSKAMGSDWIAEAFRAAHAADPRAKLFINEFGADGENAKSDALYRLVRRLVAQGVPIDGVGFQSHLNLTAVPAHRVDNLRRFAALGLDVAITEADVRIVLPSTAAKLKEQAEVYRHTLEDCMAVPRCVSFTVWGFSDRYSWIPDVQSDAGKACLFDAELTPKPAYAAVAEVLSGTT